MGEEQPELTPESESGIDRPKLMELLSELKDQGVDFDEQADSEHLAEMPDDELMEATILALEVAGFDSESLLLERGIIQGIEQNSDEVKSLQNQGYQSYSSLDADELYQRDSEENT